MDQNSMQSSFVVSLKFIGIVILILAYVISPLDLAPGPIDDVIVTVVGSIKCVKMLKAS